MGDPNKEIEDELANSMEKDETASNNPELGLGLGTAKSASVMKKERALEESNVGDVTGWKPISRNIVPSKMMFNEIGQSMRMKSLDFADIKFYSSMDEEDPESVDATINYILSKNFRLSQGEYRDLTVTDKLNVFFMIRDYTMLNSKSKNEVLMEFVSKKNSNMKVTKKVTADLFEHYELHDDLKKFYDEVERCFIIKDEDLEIRLYVPKVGVIDVVKKYVEHLRSESRSKNNVVFDKNFLVYLQYMIRDWREVDDDFKKIDELYAEYDKWSPEHLQVFDYAVSLLKVGIKPTVKIKFDNGEVETFPMNFRRFKSLLFVSDRLGRLFPSSK